MTCLLVRCENPPEWEGGICDFHLRIVCTGCGARVRVHHGTHPLVCLDCADTEGRKKRTPKMVGIST
jgi:hypothetical protein